MADTIADMEIEKEQKDSKIELLEEKKIGLPESKVIEEMTKLGLNEISSGWKCDRNMDNLKISLNNHNYNKNKKQ